MSTRIKQLFSLSLSLLLFAALTSCSSQGEPTTTNLAVTVEAPGVYELVADGAHNSETTMNADHSMLHGDYSFETTAPCTLSAYDDAHTPLATFELTEAPVESPARLTLTDSMEFVLLSN